LARPVVWCLGGGSGGGPGIGLPRRQRRRSLLQKAACLCESLEQGLNALFQPILAAARAVQVGAALRGITDLQRCHEDIAFIHGRPLSLLLYFHAKSAADERKNSPQKRSGAHLSRFEQPGAGVGPQRRLRKSGPDSASAAPSRRRR